MKILCCIATCMWILCLANYARADLLVKIVQTGNDVVVTSSGTVDKSSLIFIDPVSTGGAIQPSPNFVARAGIVTGTPFDLGNNPTLEAYISTTRVGPTSFGSGSWQAPDSGFGVTHGFSAGDSVNSPYFLLPVGYNSGDPLNAEMVYSNKTLDDLGVDLGVHNWAFSGNSVQIVVSVPEPGASAFVLAFAVLTLRQVRE